MPTIAASFCPLQKGSDWFSQLKLLSQQLDQGENVFPIRNEQEPSFELRIFCLI